VFPIDVEGRHVLAGERREKLRDEFRRERRCEGRPWSSGDPHAIADSTKSICVRRAQAPHAPNPA
jgi:hypothetical protein